MKAIHFPRKFEWSVLIRTRSKFSERMAALQNKQNMRKGILRFVAEYRSSVPNLKSILMSTGHLIANQPLLREVYKDPPLLSYRKGRSLEDVLCRRQNLVCFVCFSFVPGVSFVVLVSFVLWHFLYMLCSLAYFISSVRA